MDCVDIMNSYLCGSEGWRKFLQCAVCVLIFCSAVRIIAWGGREQLHQAANTQAPPPALTHTHTNTHTHK